MPAVKKKASKTEKVTKVKKALKTPVEVMGKTQTKRSGTLSIDVYDTKGKVAQTLELPKDIFAAVINKQLIAQAVRVYLANRRSGTASTKTRGEVAGSTRKIYRQKGTGRARHGGLRAPIFVHGGIAFGPKPRDFSLKFPKKMKKQALSSALSLVYKNGGIKVVKGLEKIEPKTKLMARVLTNLDLKPETKTLLVLPEKIEAVQRGARNIEGITLVNASQLHTYEVLKNNTVLFMADAIATLENHFKKEGDVESLRPRSGRASSA